MAQQQLSHDILALEGRHPKIVKPLFQRRKNARLICIEEHCLVPAAVPSTSTAWTEFIPSYFESFKKRMLDIDLRLQIMDANNIGAQIVSPMTSSAQGITDLPKSQAFCRQANEFIYENYLLKHPTRFFGFAILPTQDGAAAAAELERCVEEYGFVGAMVHGFTSTTDQRRGLYLDDKQFDVLWEVAQRLEKPIFIHPRIPLASSLQNLSDLSTLHGPPYGFGRDTVEHALRFMCTGVFDRFPKLKIVLGHMGEDLSWILPRAGSTFRVYTSGI